MCDAQFERIASRIDEIETVLAHLHDGARDDRGQALELEAELALLEARLDQIELLASYEPGSAREEA